MARPTNKQPTQSLEISVPQALYDYLGFLAANTAYGASENAVALYILTRQIEEMLRADVHGIAIPRISDSTDS